MKIIRNIVLFCTLFLCIPFTSIHASSDVYVDDTYGVLTSEQIVSLQQYAKQVSDTYSYGIYARIIQDETGESYDYMDDYIENYYASENLGYGDSNDGVLLLITFSNEGGSYQVYIPGNANQEMFTLDGMDRMDSAAYVSLKEHNYEQAIHDYISEAESLMTYYNEHGEAYGSNYDYDYDNGEIYHEDTSTKKLLTFVVPPIIALIVVLILKSKHKTKRIATSAFNYVNENGLHLTNQRDMYLYRTVTRTPIPRDDHDHGGGSPGGSHFSSSGGMHSGGGHF